MRDQPLYRLTRHFFSALFDLGFLSEAGAESFERMIIGICTVFFSFGMLLLRVFMGQYASLSAQPTPDPYRNALLGGDAFVMALPMWIVAFVTVLVSHALFPDETDFRVLVPLPISKRLIFGAKLLALALFCGLFIVSTHIALTPLVFFMSMSRWAQHTALVRMTAFAVASVSASVLAVFVVASVNGLLVLAASSGRMMSISAALRSLMLFALVLMVPLLGRLPAWGPEFANNTRAIYYSPPAWFVGVEQVLLGHATRQFVTLAALAGAGLAVTMTITIGTYAVLYSRFERVTRRPAGGIPQTSAAGTWRRLPLPHHALGYLAIRSFISTTLRRSALHQGVLVFVSALGVGWVLNSVVGIRPDAWPGSPAARTNISTATWAPFVLMLFSSLAARSALTLPTEQRANWIFRMTEESSLRVQGLRAAMAAVTTYGVVVPALFMAPLHWLAFGSRAIFTLLGTVLCGLLLVELLMKDWARIPFSCSYIPGKRFIPLSILIGLASLAAFTAVGSLTVQLNFRSSVAGLVPDTILCGSILMLRRGRLGMWRDHPLLFDDALPTEINPLRLSAD